MQKGEEEEWEVEGQEVEVWMVERYEVKRCEMERKTGLSEISYGRNESQSLVIQLKTLSF